MPRIPDQMLHAALDQLPLTVRGAQQLSDPSALLAYIDHVHIRTRLEASVRESRAAALREQAAQGVLSLSALNEALFTSPTRIFYRDGTRVLVACPKEFAQQPSGYSCSSVGPWLDGLADDDVPWKPGQGPFAHDSIGRQIPINGLWEWFPVQRAPNLVYVTRPCIYAGWARAAYELVYLADIRNDEQLLSDGVLKEVPRHGTRSQRTRHAPTGRCFLDEEAQEAYARLYEAGDVSWWVPGVKMGTTAPEVPQVSHETTLPKGKKARIHQAMLDCLKGKRSILRDDRASATQPAHGLGWEAAQAHAAAC